MGADFLLASTAVVDPTTGHKAIDAITDEELTDIAVDADLWIAGGYASDGDGINAATVRKALHQALTELTTAPRRDLDTIGCHCACDHFDWITGGMSWGDSPTAAFDHVVLLDAYSLSLRVPA